MPDTERLVQTLRACLANGPPLRLAVLFGSHARGLARDASDVDRRIIPIDPSLSLADELALQSDLSAAVGAEVDLLRLDADNTLLNREAARDGRSVVEAQPGAFARFQADATSAWIDFDPSLAPAPTLFLERLAQRRPVWRTPPSSRAFSVGRRGRRSGPACHTLSV